MKTFREVFPWEVEFDFVKNSDEERIQRPEWEKVTIKGHFDEIEKNRENWCNIGSFDEKELNHAQFSRALQDSIFSTLR